MARRIGLSQESAFMKIFDLFNFDETLQVMDVGASAIAETPVYKTLMDMGLAHLSAFDGDARQIAQIKQAYGAGNVSVLNHFLYDGRRRTAYLCDPVSGMSSLLKPKADALAFFNGFSRFGKVESTQEIDTTRLDDVADLNAPDFLKMDVQGAELMILKHGTERLKHCLAMQLEVSYVALYEDQPSFGEVDVYMRAAGFVPHMFLDVKRWSIAPTVFNKDIRMPGNQLLESDIVYVKDPLRLDVLSDIELQKLVILAHYAFKSVDLCVFLLRALEQRGVLKPDAHEGYMQNLAAYL